MTISPDMTDDQFRRAINRTAATLAHNLDDGELAWRLRLLAEQPGTFSAIDRNALLTVAADRLAKIEEAQR